MLFFNVASPLPLSKLFSVISMSLEHPNRKEVVENADLRQGTHATGTHVMKQAMPALRPEYMRLQPSQVERYHWILDYLLGSVMERKP
jgi:hypothetical protein